MVEAAEAGGNVICSVVHSLQSQQAGRKRYARGLRLELNGERQVQEVLLRCHKKECAIFLQVSAHRSAELMLHIDGWIPEGISRGEVRIAVHVEAFTMPVIGTRLGYSVHKAGVCAADLGVKTAAHYLELPHCRQGEEEHWIVAAALVALQRIIEVGAIERNIRIDGPLAGDH